MTGLVAAGCLLAATPLLAALLLAGGVLDRLTRHTEALVQEGVMIARLGAELHDQLQDLQRNAEQFLVLGDPALLDVFDDRRRVAAETLRRIADYGAAGSAEQLHGELDIAADRWLQSARNGTLQDDQALQAEAYGMFRRLAPQAGAISASGRATIDRQLEAISQATTQAHMVMLLSALALIPLTALLTYGFSVSVTRPFRVLSDGITALGRGRFEQRIEIAYPREMQLLGERLDWLRRRSAALEEEKDRFLRHVSHELKTPLATLQEGSALLREGSLGAMTNQQREVAEILVEAAVELGGLIGNLLAYAEWRQEERRPDMNWFETRPLISEVLIAHRLPMARRNLTVELGMRSPRLFGQRSRLRVALDNLIGNAIKHAPEGSAIEVRAGAKDGSCELCVRDHGRGVPSQEMGRIFEPFVRGDEAEESGVRGTGIGLSIVRETARAHDGTVEVENANPGARFRMVWPCPAGTPVPGP
jgi:two-component system, NtrC family, sensor histidine kinase GlrK